ncbi:E3 ubiquitin-protein like [Actinidia chinensis var. chinensis]|uniref:E3 ubiquitin-protein like n=1 Tax=Actinidia chinensis var. chinensis TaxID=1590841 RepID=A0A2R6R8A7_ACTCC|nr:E3 ubiquitin-protein like [Actinidia chinensis var. chinensis]
MSHRDIECGARSSSDPENGVVSDPSVEIKNGILLQVKAHLGRVRRERVERDCRICHLSMESIESGVAIELGCSCKDDLAAAHKNCAETWFKIKGNKTCEICNSVARNVFSANETGSTQQTNETNVSTTNDASAPAPPAVESQTCVNGHRLVNFLLTCMVFAFVISWLFHFKMPP